MLPSCAMKCILWLCPFPARRRLSTAFPTSKHYRQTRGEPNSATARAHRGRSRTPEHPFIEQKVWNVIVKVPGWRDLQSSHNWKSWEKYSEHGWQKTFRTPLQIFLNMGKIGGGTICASKLVLGLRCLLSTIGHICQGKVLNLKECILLLNMAGSLII